MRIAVLALCTTLASSAEGNAYCTKGFVMDTFCIQLGTLLDKPSLQTLQNPDQHSIHCLVDVESCVTSGYQILMQPEGFQSGDSYIQDVVLDSFGNDLVVAAARKLGLCGSCDNTGNQTQGFAATVVGTLDSSAVPGSVSGIDPPILQVTEVLPFDTPCPPASTLVPTSRPNMIGISSPPSLPSPTHVPTSFPSQSKSSAANALNALVLLIPALTCSVFQAKYV